VPLTRVYMDQTHWIALAREHYGKAHNDQIADALAIVVEASSTGRASFPLSATHYIETYRGRDPARRQRLGSFMAEVSKFHTIAGAPDLLSAEIEMTVGPMIGDMSLGTKLQPFGLGVRHAFGPSMPDYFESGPESRRRAVSVLSEEGVRDYFERALLIGPPQKPPSDGIAMPTREFEQRQLDFEYGTARKLKEWGHSSDRAHRLVLAQESQDVIEPLNALQARIQADLWSRLGSRAALTEFMLSLPAKGAVCRMRMSAHEDTNFRWHIGDLNDITALGTAAGYCDIVVAENHWGHVLRRHQRHLRARILTSLADLPPLLV
jgi:hypothetical protein